MAIGYGSQSWQKTHIGAGTATTTIKTGVGILHAITFNTKGASSNTLTVYDNTAASGTVIAIIDTTDKVTTLFYDCPFLIGLTVISATGTGADVTIMWE